MLPRPVAAPPSANDYLLLLVPSRSSAQGALSRQALRQAWAGPLAFNRSSPEPAPGDEPRAELRCLFVLGGGQADALVGADELVVAAAEGPGSLVLKVLMALRWALRLQPPPPFILKTDDDSFVCAAALLARLRPLLFPRPAPRAYLGSFSTHTRVRSSADARHHEWADAPHRALFGLETYPPYAQGALYGVSIDAAAAAVSIATRLGILGCGGRLREEGTCHVPVNEDATVGTLLRLWALERETGAGGGDGGSGGRDDGGSMAMRAARRAAELLQRHKQRRGFQLAHISAPPLPPATSFGGAAAGRPLSASSATHGRWLTYERLAVRVYASSRAHESAALLAAEDEQACEAAKPAAAEGAAAAASSRAPRRVAKHEPKAYVAVHKLSAAALARCAAVSAARCAATTVAAPEPPPATRPAAIRPSAAVASGPSKAAGSSRRRRARGAGRGGARGGASSAPSGGGSAELDSDDHHNERRVAFCFLLGYGDVAQPDAWLAFFGEAGNSTGVSAAAAPGSRRGAASSAARGAARGATLFSVYVWQDANATQLRHPFWRRALLPPHARGRTDYANGTSLELARMALFRYAYEDDARNFKFVLLSESCVPIRPLAAVHAALTRDARPRVDEMTPHYKLGESVQQALRHFTKRWVPQLAPLIARRTMMLQNRQFLIAGRAEVERFPSGEEVASLFGKVPRAEEHVFLNVLVHRLGYGRSDIAYGCVTYQRFRIRNGYRTPLPCTRSRGGKNGDGSLESSAERELLRARSERGCLFARKFARACDLRCLVATNFERFRCGKEK